MTGGIDSEDDGITKGHCYFKRTPTPSISLAITGLGLREARKFIVFWIRSGGIWAGRLTLTQTGSVLQHCKLRRSLWDHPGITGRQRGLRRLQWGSRTTGATSRGSAAAYSSGGIGWIDSEDQPGRVGSTGPTSASQDGSGSYDGGTGWLTHRGYASSTGTTRKGCRDGCRREEDDSGSGTRRRRAARLPGIGFMRAVSRGEAEATARAPLEVGRAVGRVAGADNDDGAVRRWSGARERIGGGPRTRGGASGGARQAERVGAGSTAQIRRGMDGLNTRGGYGGGSVAGVGRAGMVRGRGSNTARAGRIDLRGLGAGLAGFGWQNGLIELGRDAGI
ncbi:hypothetical protein B0H14DRAFT_3544462 [Mycena olivaceomarginata]|nr:hypothetical protein B0H14DRAFT_3544462 [Mycena olivaceomarginata]